VEPIESADEFVLDSTAPHRYPADRQEPRGDGKEGGEERRPVARRCLAPSPSGGGGDEASRRVAHAP
jgi:hypothetical protein